MFIQTEATPNPATLKFLPGPARARRKARWSSSSRTTSKALAARRAPVRDRRRQGRVLRHRLHQRDQGRGRVAASEARHPRRHHGALSLRRRRSRPKARPGSESAEEGEFFAPEDEETVKTIKELLETRVRPAVAQDGGDITFQGYRDGIVYLAHARRLLGLPELDGDAPSRHREFAPALHSGSAGGPPGLTGGTRQRSRAGRDEPPASSPTLPRSAVPRRAHPQ